MAKRDLITNAYWMLTDQAVRLAGGLLIGVWIARYLGPSDFGLLSYAVAYSSLFGILASLGLDAILVRQLVYEPEREGVLLGTACRLRLVGGAVGLIFATGSAAVSGGTPLVVVIVAIASSVYVAQCLFVIDWYFQAQLKNRASVIAQLSGFVIASAVRIALIQADASVIAFALASLLEAVLASLCLAYMYRRNHGLTKWSYDGTVARQFLRESWPLILSGFAFVIYVRIDAIMIGVLLGDTEVGIYSAAIRISEAWCFIPVILTTVAFPHLLKLRNQDQKAYEAKLQQLFSAIFAASLVAAISTEIVGHSLIMILYGEPYESASAVLKISIWSTIFISLGFASGRWLIAEKLAKYALFRNIIGLCVNVILNTVMIPIMGIKGAAISTLVSYVFANFLSYSTRKELRPLLALNLHSFIFSGLLNKRFGK